MSLKLRIACATLLAATALPAFALQLGEIQVKSALNQPLVAAIPLHPKNLTELDGMTVGLASADDFSRAGLSLTPTDRTLRFHVVTDNNGQKLILVTSTEPISDPYLDFLVEVNTREGKQLREFVALLNPVIEAPAPAIQEAPVARAPAAQSPTPQAAELPPASAFAQPTGEPGRQPPPAAQAKQAPQPSPPVARQQPAAAPVAQPAGEIEVKRGDTLSGIAREATRGTSVDVNRMMLALQAVNPDAFFKHNINNLKAGAILRMPTQDQLDQRSAAVAAAEVHRQVEAWRAARPQPATIVTGSAAEAAGGPEPKPRNATETADHLALAPATGQAEAGTGGAAATGGRGAAAGADAAAQLKAERDTLVSLTQSNADLESRVRDLEAISAKTGKLLSLKDATIAELQQKLAQTRAAQTVPGGGTGPAVASASAAAGARKPGSAAATPARPGAPWYARPLAWIIAGLVVLGLLVAGLRRHRRGGEAPTAGRGPLSDPEDVGADAVGAAAEPAYVGAPPDAQPVESNAAAPDPHEPETAEADVAEAAPETGAEIAAPSAVEPSAVAAPLAEADNVPAAASAPPASEAGYVDDPVDTKLDLARAYLDLEDSANARAMLEEVIEEGSQMQKDEAKRLLADVAG